MISNDVIGLHSRLRSNRDDIFLMSRNYKISFFNRKKYIYRSIVKCINMFGTIRYFRKIFIIRVSRWFDPCIIVITNVTRAIYFIPTRKLRLMYTHSCCLIKSELCRTWILT